MIRVKIRGLQKLINNFKALESSEIYDEVVSEVAECTYKRALSLVPVDTGKLKASIKKDKISDSIYTVSAHAENSKGKDYAVFVEYGSPTIHKPFLRPAQHECVVKAGIIFGSKLRKQWK